MVAIDQAGGAGVLLSYFAASQDPADYNAAQITGAVRCSPLPGNTAVIGGQVRPLRDAADGAEQPAPPLPLPLVLPRLPPAALPCCCAARTPLPEVMALLTARLP